MNNNKKKKGNDDEKVSRNNRTTSNTKLSGKEGIPKPDKKSSQDRQIRIPCKHFSEGSCRHGSSCKFSHDFNGARKTARVANINNENNRADRNRICNEFQGGHCRFGTSCRFAHTVYKPPSRVSGEHNISSDVITYWKTIQNTFKDNSGRNHENFPITNVDLWQDVWRAAATCEDLPQLTRFVLVRAYLSTTHRSVFDPPIKTVVKVLNEILSREVSSSQQSPQFMCRHVLDVCKNRLQPALSSGDVQLEKQLACLNIQEIQDDLDNLWDNFSSLKISQQFSLKDKQSLINDAKCISDYQDELVKVFNNNSTLLNSVVGCSSSAQDKIKPWLGWKQHPTLHWLLSAEWMKEFPSERLGYSSPTEYAECMLKIWTTLTFYWGSGAMWPLCSHNYPGAERKRCGQPLLMSTNQSNGCPCTMRVSIGGRDQMCQKPAVWKCHFHKFNHHTHEYQHDSICGGCLTRRQNVLVGGGNANYSTDIYDALVENEIHRNGQSIMLLSHTTSRKPPETATNWRTTYRLQSSALVAVVKVAREKQSLEPSMPVYWAELVPFVQTRDPNLDFRHKSKGEVAVRFLSTGDCADLKIAHPSLEKGCRVVVIDLRVFVPEVVSVLSAMANDSFVNHLQSIPFINQLIGTSDSTRIVSRKREASIPQVVERAIFESDMECIKKLDANQKGDICTSISRLRAVKSLYGTQLDAFADALKFQVHCIQGPPGTGKSYVGVCLVLSLLIIRKVVKAAGFPLGPIVMLSYKNHALDEFLCDILDFESDLKQPGKLIRAGNTDNATLSEFSESRSREERKALQDLNVLLEYHKTVRTVCKDWKRCAQYFESLSCLTEEEARVQADWKPEICPEYKESTASKYSMHALLYAAAVAADINADYIDDIDETDCDALITDLPCSCDISRIQSIDSILCIEDLQRWYEEVEHWRPNNSGNPSKKSSTENTFFTLLLFYISQWLSGKHPPPRCHYRYAPSEQCMKCAVPKEKYCADHRCSASGIVCMNP